MGGGERGLFEWGALILNFASRGWGGGGANLRITIFHWYLLDIR